jgi:hypothetical protein
MPKMASDTFSLPAEELLVSLVGRFRIHHAKRVLVTTDRAAHQRSEFKLRGGRGGGRVGRVPAD